MGVKTGVKILSISHDRTVKQLSEITRNADKACTSICGACPASVWVNACTGSRRFNVISFASFEGYYAKRWSC